MQLHPRFRTVQKARNEIVGKILELEHTHELTDAEIIGILGDYLAEKAKYMIRSERHPDDPDKKGDEA
jgi:hypothetical protein